MKSKPVTGEKRKLADASSAAAARPSQKRSKGRQREVVMSGEEPTHKVANRRMSGYEEEEDALIAMNRLIDTTRQRLLLPLAMKELNVVFEARADVAAMINLCGRPMLLICQFLNEYDPVHRAFGDELCDGSVPFPSETTIDSAIDTYGNPITTVIPYTEYNRPFVRKFVLKTRRINTRAKHRKEDQDASFFFCCGGSDSLSQISDSQAYYEPEGHIPGCPVAEPGCYQHSDIWLIEQGFWTCGSRLPGQPEKGTPEEQRRCETLLESYHAEKAKHNNRKLCGDDDADLFSDTDVDEGRKKRLDEKDVRQCRRDADDNNNGSGDSDADDDEDNDDSDGDSDAKDATNGNNGNDCGELSEVNSHIVLARKCNLFQAVLLRLKEDASDRCEEEAFTAICKEAGLCIGCYTHTHDCKCPKDAADAEVDE